MTTSDRTIKFPHRRSIGTLYVASDDQPEEWQLLSQVRGLVVAPENQPIKWEWLEEARGNVKVPAEAKVKLKVASRGASLAAVDQLECDDLHAVDLSHCQMIDASLVHLARLSGLRVLELTSSSFGDEALAAIDGLSNLQSLGLSHTLVTSAGLAHLVKLKNLREIWLSGTNVDDTGLRYFAKMNKLVQLGLSSTKVTDVGLLHLVDLHKLLRLYLFNTKVTHNGTQALRRLLPNLKVKWHPTKIHTQDAHVADFDAPTEGEQKNPDILAPACLPCVFEDDRFWQIIELLDWDKSGDDASIIEPAITALVQMSVEEICGFAEVLAEKLHMLDGEAYACQIGTDSYQGAKGDFSKNWFLYIRCCVVANGRDFYEQACAHPDQMPKDMEFQALLAIPAQAFKRKTGKRFNYVTKYNYETFSNKELWSPA